MLFKNNGYLKIKKWIPEGDYPTSFLKKKNLSIK